LRWLETHRYWSIYYVIYILLIVILAATDWPGWNRQEWASLITVSAGAAVGLAAAVEIGVRAMLLIQPTIRKIRTEGRIEELTSQREAVVAADDLSEEARAMLLKLIDARLARVSSGRVAE
jgi:hypothetical protein